MKHVLRLLILVVGMFWTFPVFGIGLGVTPSELRFEGKVHEVFRETLIIQNLSEEPADYEMFADTHPQWFSFSEPFFTLREGELKEILLTVKPDQTGEFETNISIVSFLVEKSAVNTGSGIKLPVQLSIHPPRQIFGLSLPFFFIFLTVLIFAFVALILRLKNVGKSIQGKL